MSQNLIFDFNKESDLANWYVVDDGVMGGRSDGNLFLNADGHGEYFGDVSLENNGGFSSIRYYCENLDLSGKSKFVIRVKGDGKKYQFRAKKDARDYYSYVKQISTTGEWETIEVAFDEMYPSFRGRRLDAANFTDNQVQEIGILVGNKKAESFKLLIDKIEVQ